MKKRLGCLFYPVVLFLGIGLFSVIVIAMTDNPEDEVFTVADTEKYTIDYWMNDESGIFFKAVNKTDEVFLVQLTDLVSGDQPLQTSGSGSGELVAREFEARQSGVKTPMDNETNEQTNTRQILIGQSQYLYGNRTDTELNYNVENASDELVNELISHKVTGTLVIYTYNEETGETVEIGRHPFTKEAGIDGQI